MEKSLSHAGKAYTGRRKNVRFLSISSVLWRNMALSGGYENGFCGAKKPLRAFRKAFMTVLKSLFREPEQAFPRRCFSEKNSVTVCSGLTYNG